MIYIPPSWWHHIEALDGNVSMLLPFDMSRAEQVALPRPWTMPDWGAATDPEAVAAAAAAVTAAAQAITSLPSARAAVAAAEAAEAAAAEAAAAEAAAEAAAKEVAAATAVAAKISFMWSELHSLTRASSPSLEAAPPASEEAFDGAARTRGIAALKTRCSLSAGQVGSFRRRRYLRVAGLLPPAALAEVKSRLLALASRGMGGRDASLPPAHHPQPDASMPQHKVKEWWSLVSEPAVRSWHIQQMWAADAVIRALVLSPRIGDLVCQLLGCDHVRLYHDNALSRAPGSKPTRWHCDDGPAGYMLMGSRKVVTVYVHTATEPVACLPFHACRCVIVLPHAC